MTVGRPARTPRIADTQRILPGRNVIAVGGWRDRLLRAAEPYTYMQIHRRAVRRDGTLVPYTTIRTTLIKPGAEIELGTLAAICDALGVSLESITGRQPMESA